MRRNYYARELEAEQTLENLQRFSDKLAMAHAVMKRKAKQRGSLSKLSTTD